MTDGRVQHLLRLPTLEDRVKTATNATFMLCIPKDIMV